jgi:hypothetical protein
MTKDELNVILSSGKTANSIYTILGKKLANGELAWLTAMYPLLPAREALYLYTRGSDSPPKCINESCSNSTKFLGYTKGYRAACSISCARKHELATRGAEIRAKTKATLQARYGVSTAYAVSGWTDARERNRVSNIGRKQSEEVCAKIRTTNLSRYGFENPMSSKEVREKVKATMIDRYGGYHLGVYGPRQRHILWCKRKKQALIDEFKIELYAAEEFSTAEKQKCRCLICGKDYHVDLSDGKVTRCPDCFFIPADRSRAEHELSQFVRDLGFRVETNVKSKDLIYPFTLDIWVPELKLAIEFNGSYWHNVDHVGKAYHLNKTELCAAKGITLIHVFEYVYEAKRELVKARIAYLCGKSNAKLYARRCKLVDVPSNDARVFVDENHLQGYVAGKSFGLSFDDMLVGVLVYGKPRFNNNADLELLRLCFKQGYSIIGGASKLLTELGRREVGKRLLSYHDRCWGISSVYDKLGFKKGKASTPGYVYVKNNMVISRWQAQKHKLPALLGGKFNAALTEEENMRQDRYIRIYDCGQDVFHKQL